MSQDTNERESGRQGKATTTQQIDEEREAEALLGLRETEASEASDEWNERVRPLAMNEMLRNAEKGAASMTKGLREEPDHS